MLQKALGESALTSAWVLSIWSGPSVVAALQARRLAARGAAATQLAGALLLCGIGEAALFGLHARGSWTSLVPGLAVAGVGSGVLNAALARLAVSSVPADRAAMGSGANNTARYLGSSLGVAVVITVVSAGRSPHGPAAATAAGGDHAGPGGRSVLPGRRGDRALGARSRVTSGAGASRRAVDAGRLR